MPGEAGLELRAWVDYFRDLGVHDFYRRGEFVAAAPAGDDVIAQIHAESIGRVGGAPGVAPVAVAESAKVSLEETAPERHIAAPFAEPQPIKLVSFNNLAPLPAEPIAPAD